MTGRRRALLLASNGPKRLSPLEYAVSDRDLLAEMLSWPAFGFDIVALSDAASATETRESLERFCETCEPEDTVIVYFAGHGYLQGGLLRLLWHDTDLERVLTTALNANAVYEAMAFCRAKNKLLILDCCNASAAVPGARDVEAPEMMAIAPLQAETFLLLLASGRLEKAREFASVGGGFLTRTLCSILQERGGTGTGLDLDDVAQAILERAHSYNRKVPLAERVPLPRLFGSRIGDFSFARSWGKWVPLTVEHRGVPLVLLPVRAGSDEAWLIGKTMVTNSQYASLGMRQPQGKDFDRNKRRWTGPFFPLHDGRFNHADHPVVCVSYDDAREFAERLDDSSGIVRSCQVLPTDLWEFAAGWRSVSDPTMPVKPGGLDVGHFEADGPATVKDCPERMNSLGIVDLLGNVWEWCATERSHGHGYDSPRLSAYDDDYIRAPFERSILATEISIVVDDAREDERRYQVELRGGSFLDSDKGKTRSVRATELQDGVNCRHSDLGFRVAARVPLSALPDVYQMRLRACPTFLTWWR